MRTLPLVIALFASVTLLACGSEQSKEDRGLVIDNEEAVPGSEAEFEETAAERQKQMVDEDDEMEDTEFERSQPGD